MQRNGHSRRGNGPLHNVPRTAPHEAQFIRRLPIPLAQDPRDNYMGFVYRPRDEVATSTYEELTPESMWRDHISKRQPLKIDGLINDDGWDGSQWSDINFLQTIAGNTQVKVEPIDATLNQFGSNAKRSKVLLADFLQVLKNEQDAGKWYMTTQYIDSEDEDEEEELQNNATRKAHKERSTDMASPSPPTPALSSSSSPGDSSDSSAESDHISVAEDALPDVDLDFSLPPPTDALSPFFPLPTPQLMGGLVLQQCNLWLGNGVDGKSSGLHHDFHDNLYLLLSGRKRFLIWPPSAHRWLEPHGAVRHVHHNGLIEYGIHGQPPLRPDGLTQREYLQWLIRARQRATLEADERAAKLNGEGRTVKALRKGKGRQTDEQAEKMALLQVAEAGLALMDAVNLESISDLNDTDESAASTASSDLGMADGDLEALGARFPRADAGSGEDESDDFDDQEMWHEPRGFSEDNSDDVDSNKLDRDSASPQRKRTRPLHPRESDSPVSSPGNGKRDVLRIPAGGLPGGFRGSLKDLDAEWSDGEEDEDEAGPAWILQAAAEAQLGESDADEEFDNIADEQIQAFARGGAQSLPEGAGPGFFDSDAEPLLELASPSSDAPAISLIREVDEDEEEEDDFSADASSETGFPILRRTDWHALNTNGLAHNEDYEEQGSDEGSAAEAEYTDESDYDIEEGENALANLERQASAQEHHQRALASARGRMALSDEDDELEDEEEEEESDGDDIFAPPSFSAIRPQVMHYCFGINDHPADKRHRRDLHIDGLTPYDRIVMPRIGCPKPVEVHLEPGQMLYLPAGWFHEVTSYCDPEDERNGSVSDANVHMALNYWFHPPTATRRNQNVRLATNVRSSSKSVDVAAAQARPPHLSPYDDEEVWDEIRKTVQARVDGIRSRAAAQFLAARQQASSKLGTDVLRGDEALQRLAQRYLRPSAPQQAAAQAQESAAPGKRKREG